MQAHVDGAFGRLAPEVELLRVDLCFVLDEREDAHAILVSLRMIHDALYSSIDDENILKFKQKGQYRNG